MATQWSDRDMATEIILNPQLKRKVRTYLTWMPDGLANEIYNELVNYDLDVDVQWKQLSDRVGLMDADDDTDINIALIVAGITRSPTQSSKKSQVEWKVRMSKDLGFKINKDARFGHELGMDEIFPLEYGKGWNGAAWDFDVADIRGEDWAHLSDKMAYPDRLWFFSPQDQPYHFFINWESGNPTEVVK